MLNRKWYGASKLEMEIHMTYAALPLRQKQKRLHGLMGGHPPMLGNTVISGFMLFLWSPLIANICMSRPGYKQLDT